MRYESSEKLWRWQVVSRCSWFEIRAWKPWIKQYLKPRPKAATAAPIEVLYYKGTSFDVLPFPSPILVLWLLISLDLTSKTGFCKYEEGFFIRLFLSKCGHRRASMFSCPELFWFISFLLKSNETCSRRGNGYPPQGRKAMPRWENWDLFWLRLLVPQNLWVCFGRWHRLTFKIFWTITVDIESQTAGNAQFPQWSELGFVGAKDAFPVPPVQNVKVGMWWLRQVRHKQERDILITYNSGVRTTLELEVWTTPEVQ